MLVTKCRYGITTNPDRRKAEWEREYYRIYGWRVLPGIYSKQDAQDIETRSAKEETCEAHPGGANPQDENEAIAYAQRAFFGGLVFPFDISMPFAHRIWYVYKFYYDEFSRSIFDIANLK